jgi:hypothetical protein
LRAAGESREGGSVALVTSREFFAGLGAAHFVHLDALTDSASLDLLRGFVGGRADEDASSARAIIGACDGLPLALAIAGARLRLRPGAPIGEYANELETLGGRLAMVGQIERAWQSAFQATLVTLGPPARRLMLLIGALGVVDIEPDLCSALLGQSAAGALEELEAQQLLLTAADGRRRVHALLRDYLRRQSARDLGRATIASAQERRVQWLVQVAEERNRVLRTEET